MGKKSILSAVEDIYSASELINESRTDITDLKAFEIENVIAAANLGCIGNKDKVIIISSVIDTITLAVSYSFVPKKLISYKININSSKSNSAINEKQRWNNINQLLSGYIFTKPIFHDTSIDDLENDEKELYDVSIAGFIIPDEVLEKDPLSRFKLEAGIEYEVFKKLLVKSCSLLQREGKLIILVKPGWVLKAWELIHELGLQLEYDSYKKYIGGYNHPNVIIWLRFVKKETDVNFEDHKRNILALMKDNNIDRLFAHRNNLIFPYVELSYNKSEAYISLVQNYEYMQYFFSKETTVNLARLCEGYTACLVTPSVAQYAHSIGKNVVLFERDNRFREKDGLKFAKYDLNKGLTKFQINRYAKKFDRIVCDPPFDINLEVLSRNILQLAKAGNNCFVYVVFPESRKDSLIRAMKSNNFLFEADGANICIEYAKPPKIVRINGKQAIWLYKFSYNPSKKLS